MKRYVGIDVGQRSLFGAAISQSGNTWTIEFSCMTDVAGVLAWCTDVTPTAVAIDAPPAPSLGLARTGRRRVAEEMLSIGGCYGTPPDDATLPWWMTTGMHCHRYVAGQLGAPADLTGTGVVFEVHPTYGFRSMLGVIDTPGRVSCDPERILRPKSPRGSTGHRQRIEMLRVLLGQLGAPWTEALHAQLLARLDWTDATISAVLSVLRARGETRGVGDPNEGTIVVADPTKLRSREAVRLAASTILATRSAAPAPPKTKSDRKAARPSKANQDSAAYALLRLGSQGLGCLSREDTIDALRGQLSEDQIVIPVGVRSIGSRWCARAEEGGFWLLVANRGVVALALHAIAIVGKGRGQSTPKEAVLNESRDPWPGVDASAYWLVCDALVDSLDERVTALQTRKAGSWSPGVPANQTAWLEARGGSEALVRKLHAAKEAEVNSFNGPSSSRGHATCTK